MSKIVSLFDQFDVDPDALGTEPTGSSEDDLTSRLCSSPGPAVRVPPLGPRKVFLLIREDPETRTLPFPSEFLEISLKSQKIGKRTIREERPD